MDALGPCGTWGITPISTEASPVPPDKDRANRCGKPAIKLHGRGEANFSFFQSFFRDHKYLWRACQSFLGFLTECVTREGLLWGFIVNCSKLYSCQGAVRSYTVSGESKQSPQYDTDAAGGICPCLRGHHKACALLMCHFSLRTLPGMVRRNSLFLGRNHSK